MSSDDPMKGLNTANSRQVMELLKSDTPEYTFDDIGRAYVRWPLAVRREKATLGDKNKALDPNVTPTIYIFDAHGRNLLVNKEGFEARDKAVWFSTEKEAIEAKSASLSKRKKELEKKMEKTEEKG